MSGRVNLDALVRRADFDETDAQGNSGSGAKDDVSINDFKKNSFFIKPLRKPDFQRETSEWDAKKILGILESFLTKDLIPAIILWLSKDNLTFVIDGSHRLSALIAWVNDDYGDGEISKQFFDGIIPEEQIEIARKTRVLIEKRIGSFADHELANSNPEKVSAKIREQAGRLGTSAIQLQWVKGDSKNADNSFRKINEQGVPINLTEKKILNARKKPIGIAARAIIRGGKGTNFYWKNFSKETQAQLQALAENINALLFLPRFKNPISTTDLPVAGKLYSAQSLPLVWDFIRIVNPFDKTTKDKDGLEINDPDGAATIVFLKKCERIAQRINSDASCSLGLHPLVYFYSESGSHKPASFYAITSLVLDFESDKKLYQSFTTVRAQFESLLLGNSFIIQQLVRAKRGAPIGYLSIKNFYLLCIQHLSAGKTISETIEEIKKTDEFSSLPSAPVVDHPSENKDGFSRSVKSRAFIKEALVGIPTCGICNGFVHTNSVSIDHIKRKEDGGTADASNAQVTHPYCNTGYKESRHAESKKV